MTDDPSQELRNLPSMSRLLEEPAVRELLDEYPRELVRKEITELLDGVRERIRSGQGVADPGILTEQLVAEARRRLVQMFQPTLRRVINATGVIVFTNAGRAPLSREVARYVAEVAAGYSNLEYDLEAGARGRRDAHVEARLRSLTGCAAATVCNNAAAALLLILNTLAAGRKVVVSRGELIEIGGSFRLPAIMERSGAILREVGTTNRTRLADYREALDDQTALILKAHPSNFRIVGFTQAPELEELVGLSREAGLPLVYDIGSGLLSRSELPVLRDEPAAQDALTAGTDLVCFSGDKLLGGPQAGLILGRSDLVQRVRRNPLMRALRVDKLGYAALERTLAIYQQGRARQELPVWRMLELPAAEIRSRAESLLGHLAGFGLRCRLREDWSVSGGGSAPEERIATWLLGVSVPGCGANRIESWLRSFPTPILVRVEGEEVLLDLRTVLPEEEASLLAAFAEAVVALPRS